MLSRFSGQPPFKCVVTYNLREYSGKQNMKCFSPFFINSLKVLQSKDSKQGNYSIFRGTTFGYHSMGEDTEGPIAASTFEGSVSGHTYELGTISDWVKLPTSFNTVDIIASLQAFFDERPSDMIVKEVLSVVFVSNKLVRGGPAPYKKQTFPFKISDYRRMPSEISVRVDETDN